MSTSRPKNSVRERLDSAVALLRAEGQIEAISIAELCRIAGISRANLYSHHKDFLAAFLGRPSRRSPNLSLPTPSVVGELDILRHRIKALQYITLELSDELRRERLCNDELRAEILKKAPLRGKQAK